MCVINVCICCFSNVVEKCVSHSSRVEKAMLIEEICSVNDGFVAFTLYLSTDLMFETATPKSSSVVLDRLLVPKREIKQFSRDNKSII